VESGESEATKAFERSSVLQETTKPKYYLRFAMLALLIGLMASSALYFLDVR
jgi:hypothetical protein